MKDLLARFQVLLGERILILDGAMGTMIQRHGLSEADYRGERFADWPRDLKGNNDLLTLTQPQVIGGIHQAYLDAGADILETNTFNANRISMADYGMEDLSRELNVAAARLARDLADAAATPDQPRFVAGVLGPTNRTLSISPDVNDPGFRNLEFPTLVAAYVEAAEGLVEGGADLLLIETIFDTLNAKAAIVACEEVFEKQGQRLPVMISGTITDQSGRTLTGQTTEAFYNSLRHVQPISIVSTAPSGPMNCASIDRKSVVVIIGEIGLLVVGIDQVQAGAAAIEEANLAVPAAAALVDELGEGAEGGNAGAGADHEQAGALVLGHLERAAVGAAEGDLVAGLGVAEIVGGDAGKAFPADFVDVEAAAHQDLQIDAFILGPRPGIGDGVTAEMIGVAKGVGARDDHADALAFDELEVRIRYPQAQMAHLHCLLGRDASGVGDLGRDRGANGVEFAHGAGSGMGSKEFSFKSAFALGQG